jgi:hypothetical protein
MKKNRPGSNTLAYFVPSSVTKIKKFSNTDLQEVVVGGYDEGSQSIKES